MDQDEVAHLLELEDKLAQIRQQIHSKLENQKHVAIILSAVEENMEEQQQVAGENVVNYLVSLMSLLDQAVSTETHEIREVQIATSVTYLLDIMFRYVPKQMLRSKFAEILTKLAPCITDEKAGAPLVRPAIGCLETLLVAQDAQSWNNTQNLSIAPSRGLSGLLELSLDPRPKVRKRAQDAVGRIMANPPVSPSAEHVAAPLVAEFAINALASAVEEASSASNKKIRAQGGAKENNAKSIHILKLIKSVLYSKQWPTTRFDTLCDLLLEISRSADQYMVSSAFECFEALFQAIAESAASSGLADHKFTKILNIIYSLKPSNTDAHLAGAWIAVVAKGVTTFGFHNPVACLDSLPELIKVLSGYLQSEVPEIFISASQCIEAIMVEAIPDEILLSPPLVEREVYEKVDDTISLFAQTYVDFLSIKYAHCAREVLGALAAALRKFRFRSNPDFLAPLEIVGGWRTNEDNFLELRGEIESVLGAGIAAMGPDVILGCLPLNLTNASDENPGRAWLIPLIRDNTKNSHLALFTKDFMPLIQYFEDKIATLSSESVQSKVFETVISQLWSTLTNFCDLPVDLTESFTDEFAADLSSMLYSKVELRPVICHALKKLVKSNYEYATGISKADGLLEQQFPVSEGQKNVDYLAAKAPNLLAVLFNVYTQTAPNARGYILETIDAVLQIASSEELTKTFNNVCGLLKKAFDEEPTKGQGGPSSMKMSATLLDLIIAMAAYVDESSYSALFSIFNTTVNSDDALTQKRAYRIITKLSESEQSSRSVMQYIDDIENVIIQSSKKVHTSAKAMRLSAIKLLVDVLPLDHGEFIIQVVPEVILATKDNNEKSREAAFNTLISMANKMSQEGCVMRLSKVPGYDAATPDQPASVAEFFKITSAGLIGESQHMVSATVTAYSCLIFEFKVQVPPDVLMEIYDTIELYLTSNSREIVKSAIGFAKVCCLALPEELMKPKIPSLLPKLLRWSHEHTGHFKAKVKHIIERLIRKYGYEYIDQHFPEEDKRLLVNIRKTRDRSKRKAEDLQTAVPKLAESNTKGSRFMSALDEALYESSNGEESAKEESSNRNGKANRFIVESKENPLDLLDSQTLAHISSTRPKKYDGKTKKNAAEDDVFSFDADGKLKMKSDKNSTGDEELLGSATSGINAYLDAVKNGPVRGQKNKLKFKKGARANDNDMSDGEASELPPRKLEAKNKKILKKKGGPKFKSRRKL
ncbi:LANO_0B02256g1_1 [Lachancea nothofagi CBS 11611]|uniref:LANO_0B02256g1_1 n=1 Tax=Lachancea nothofagi CBS 11611 TaxID=1266666 RepID=A0A1G4IVV2_9SACH|nr:LANO_0B02256g1_1 [Lachancea nothofagi CBS 11611]